MHQYAKRQVSHPKKELSHVRYLVRKLFVPLALIIIFVCGSIALFFLKTPESAQAAWFDGNWGYRQRLSFTNSGSQVTFQKVKFDIDTQTLITAGQLQSGCQDLRFTDMGGQVLKYYIDTSGGACNTASTDVYLLFPTIIAGENIAYMYYGNLLATAGTQSTQFSEATFAPGVGPTFATAETASGPVSYWKFDEGTGQNLYDTQSSSLTSTLGASTATEAIDPTWLPESQCISGKCLRFDGTDDYARIGNIAKLKTTSKTVSFWARPNATITTTKGLFSANNVSNYYVGFTITNRMIISYANSTPTQVTCSTANNVVVVNEWHHYAYTFSVSGVNVTVTMYKDGAQVGTCSATTGYSTTYGSNFIIGSFGTGSAFYQGDMDEIKFYNYARSTTQIKSEFLQGATSAGNAVTIGGGKQEFLSDGLTGYWKMDESSWTNDCSTSTISDGSGNGSSGISCPASTGPTGGSTGKFNKGGTLDGVEEYIQVANNAAFDPGTGDFSASVWVKPTTLTGGQTGILRYLNNITYFILEHNDNDTILVEFRDGTCAAQSFSTTGLLTAGIWNHIVLTVDRDNEARVYLNGVFLTSSPTVARCQASMTGGILNFGRHTQYFDGVVDEVRLYKRVLSADDVKNLYDWAPGPVGYWKMDEKTGASALDTSGNGNNGTLNGNPLWTQGKFGAALDFDGTDDFVSMVTPQIYDNTDFTVMGWLKADTTPSNMTIYSEGRNASTGFVWFWLNSQKLELRLNDGTNADQYASTQSLLPGQWYHVAATRSGTTVGLYINGKKEILATNSSLSNGTVPTLDRAAIGQLYRSTNNFFMDGILDDIKVYDYVRTPGQIIEDMNAGHPLGGSPIGSQLLYYKFDEGYGTTVNNSVPLNYPGTLFNAVTWNPIGKTNKALNFDGTSSHIAVQGTSGTDFRYAGEDLSFSMWFKVDSTDDGASLISKPWNASGQYNWRLSTSGTGSTVTLTFHLLGATAATFTTSAVNAADWTHVAVTLQGSTKRATIYINGKPNVTNVHTISDWTPSSGDLARKLTIGCIYPYETTNCAAGATTHDLDGSIDEVKVYNSYLSAEQVRMDYNAGAALNFGSTGASESGTLTDGAGDPPTAYWNFDEKGHTTVLDTSGGGNNLTWNGTSTPHTANAKYGAGANLNGTSDFAVSTSSTLINLTTGSVSLWFKPNPLQTAGTIPFIFSHNAAGSGGRVYFQTNATGTSVNCILGTGGVIGTATITANDWHHGVCTWNGTSGSFYIDGRLVATTTFSGQAAQTTVKIGYQGSGTVSDTTFKGLVDDVKIYAYARTPSQVAYEYNRGRPIGWWKFDECQGTTANDASGFALTGTWNGTGGGTQTSVGTCSTSGTAWGNGATGKLNSSLNFDGTDDYVNMGDVHDMRTSDWTTAAWVKSTDTHGGIISKSFLAAGSGRWGMVLDSGTLLAIFDGGTPFTIQTTGVNDGNWHHVATTYDRDGLMTLYVDGYQKGTTSIAASSAVDMNTSCTLLVGGYWNNPCSTVSAAYDLNGQIDDVRVYNYALSATQIKQLMNDGASVRFAPSTGSP